MLSGEGGGRGWNFCACRRTVPDWGEFRQVVPHIPRNYGFALVGDTPTMLDSSALNDATVFDHRR